MSAVGSPVLCFNFSLQNNSIPFIIATTRNLLNNLYLIISNVFLQFLNLQRFGNDFTAAPLLNEQLNGVADKVRQKAEKYGRKFYIQYDVSWTSNQLSFRVLHGRIGMAAIRICSLDWLATFFGDNS